MKQLRISAPDIIRKRLPEFLRKQVSLVLKDGTSVFGTLAKVDAQTIELQNMRLKKMTIVLDNVSEFFADLEN